MAERDRAAARYPRGAAAGVAAVLAGSWSAARLWQDTFEADSPADSDTCFAVLVDALRRVTEGECVVDPSIVSRLMQRRRPDSPAVLDKA